METGAQTLKKESEVTSINKLPRDFEVIGTFSPEEIEDLLVALSSQAESAAHK